MFHKLSMAAQAILPKKDIPCSDANVTPKPEVPSAPLPIDDPKVQRIIDDFFKSTYWPYLKEILMREIIGFQVRADKQLQGALSDPRDTNGRMAAYHGGRIKSGDELKLIIERLKKNYSQ